MIKKHFSTLVDTAVLFLFHLQKSKKSQFQYVGEPAYLINAEDLNLAFPNPTLPEINFSVEENKNGYQVGEYSFYSDFIDGFKHNPAHGIYYQKEHQENRTHIIVVHGWRMDSIDRLKNLFLDSFTNEGYDMYFVTLPFHFHRLEGGAFSGEFMVTANTKRTLDAFRQAVGEIRSLIRYLKEIYGGKVVIIGVSLGGFVTNLTSVIEEEVDVLVSIKYPNSLAYAIWNTHIGKYIRRDLEQNGYSYEQLKRDWSILEAEHWQPKVEKSNILLISGLYDKYIDLEDATKIWEAWDKPERIIYECGHSGIVLNRSAISSDVTKFVKERV